MAEVAASTVSEKSANAPVSEFIPSSEPVPAITNGHHDAGKEGEKAKVEETANGNGTTVTTAIAPDLESDLNGWLEFLGAKGRNKLAKIIFTWLSNTVDGTSSEKAKKTFDITSLSNGTILCKLANALQQDSIKEFHQDPEEKEKQLENVAKFLAFAKQSGVKEEEICKPEEIVDGEAATESAVLRTLVSVALKFQEQNKGLSKETLNQVALPTSSSRFGLSTFRQMLNNVSEKVKPRTKHSKSESHQKIASQAPQDAANNVQQPADEATKQTVDTNQSTEAAAAEKSEDTTTTPASVTTPIAAMKTNIKNHFNKFKLRMRSHSKGESPQDRTEEKAQPPQQITNGIESETVAEKAESAPAETASAEPSKVVDDNGATKSSEKVDSESKPAKKPSIFSAISNKFKHQRSASKQEEAAPPACDLANPQTHQNGETQQHDPKETPAVRAEVPSPTTDASSVAPSAAKAVPNVNPSNEQTTTEQNAGEEAAVNAAHEAGKEIDQQQTVPVSA